MIADKEFGFVLRRFFPIGNKLSLLTPGRGKITLVTHKNEQCKNIWPGMIISFSPEQPRPACLLAGNLEIIATPPGEKIDDLCWLHHLAELCYFCIPSDMPCDHLFNTIRNCMLLISYKETFHTDGVESTLFKHIQRAFVCTLLHLMDCSPSPYNAPWSQTLTEMLIQVPCIDFNNQQKVDYLKGVGFWLENSKQANIDEWILTCLKNHPQFHLFNTPKYIYTNDQSRSV